jgi:pimeloyl-ACP methyl ester carboxylesterase
VARPGAPALLLIHGFGAFGDQWRGNMAALAAAGYSVYAPTLPGFGRSEKAALTYSQECWRDYIRWVAHRGGETGMRVGRAVASRLPGNRLAAVACGGQPWSVGALHR